MNTNQSVTTCRWARPTLFLHAPYWFEAETCPWTCTCDASLRVLKTTARLHRAAGDGRRSRQKRPLRHFIGKPPLPSWTRCGWTDRSRRGVMAGTRLPAAMAAVLVMAAAGAASSTQPAKGTVDRPRVTILAYHRFGATVKDAMTVRTATFRWQLSYLRQHHHPVIPLGALVSYLLGHSPAPPRGAVVITVDDGHESVFTEMLPLVREYQVPVTLFIYPSAISNASYAMTWEQLDPLHRTGLVDIQSHTYWHPNFHAEKRRLSPTAYRAFASLQLVKARSVLESRLGIETDLIAWPFGICDDELIDIARGAGYTAGFTIERRLVTSHERIMALPRFLVTDSASGRLFASMLPQEAR